MKAIFLNGSPRKNWNTHKMLLEAERGAKEVGAETELIHLFDLSFTDCKSCFACKLRGNKTNGICAIRDELRPVLEKIHEANAVVIGTPIYYGDLTGEAASVIHRMLFPTMHYEDDNTHDELLPIKKKCGLIVTGNATTMHIKMGGGAAFKNTAKMISMIFGSCETLYACDTYQFTDYRRYYAGMFNEAHKAEVRDKQFPFDLQNAYELGKRLCQ
jgi:Multimeric flavodoxin WrbA